MKQHLIGFVLAALAFVGLAGPARAFDPEDAASLEKIRVQLRDIDAKLNLLKPDQLKLSMEMIGGDMKHLVDDMAVLKKRIEALEARLAREDADRSVRRSFSPSNAAMTGSILLDNRSPWRSWIILDGVTHELAPFQTLPLPPRPAGPVTYEVIVDGWGRIRPPTTTELAPDQSRVIWVQR